MLCTDKVVNGWSTVLFWIERVMVWHALMFDSFVPKWPNQSCASLFIIEGLLMFISGSRQPFAVTRHIYSSRTMQLELKTDYRIPSCIPACETDICWTGVNNMKRCMRPSKRLKLWWTCIIIEEAKVEMNFQDITTMDGSKVYRMAAKDRKKKTRASKMGKRQK